MKQNLVTSRNKFDCDKVFRTVFRYLTTNWCARWQDTKYSVQHPTASLAVSLCSWLSDENSKKDDNESNKSHYCNTSCAQPKQRTFEPQQLEQNSSEVGIFPHKPTIESVREKDGVASVNDEAVVKDTISTDTECREYGEETLYRPLQLHTALSGNEFELGTIDKGAIVYPHSSHVSNNVASERREPACVTSKEFEEFEEYLNSGREVPQRYQNAYDLRENQMKLKQQEDSDKVDSRYYKAPDQHSASSSHRRRTIVQSVMNLIAKLSELRVSSNTFSDRLPTSATTDKTAKMDVSSNCMNACLDDSRRLPNNNNFMQNVRASTPLAVDRKTFVDTNKDMSNNYKSQHKGYEKVSKVQRKQMPHLSIRREDRNNIIKKAEQKRYKETCENALKFAERIMRQTRIQIGQSANRKIDQSACQEIDAYAAGLPHVRALKSAVRSARSTLVDGSSTESARQPPETYKKGKRTLFNVHSRLDADESTSTQTKISTSPNKTSSFQNYTIPVKTCQVNMVRTKQMVRKERDDHRRDDRCRDGDRRRDDEREEPEKRPRGRPPQAPASTTYTCFFCKKENKQQTNHRRHLIIQHGYRIDGTPATEADIEQAKAWSSHEPASQRQRASQQSYKSKEFVSTDSDADTTPEQSAPPSSPPSPSLSPPRQRHKRPRKESPPPRRQSLRRSQPSRTATPPPAPPAKACRRVRFEKSESPVRRDEKGASRKKFEPLPEPKASTSKEHQPRSTQRTADRKRADADRKQLKIDRSKIDPLVRVAE